MSDSLDREQASLLGKTNYIWGNQKYNEVIPVTINYTFNYLTHWDFTCN